MITLLQTFFAGLVGTGLMSTTMTIIHLQGWANADMIRALGSSVTKDYEHALLPGLGMHLFAGMLFAIPYAAVLGAIRPGGMFMVLGVGALMGFVHGIVASLVLLAVVSTKHPLKQFQHAGVEVALAHIAGHVAYGIGVAAVVTLLGIDWGVALQGG